MIADTLRDRIRSGGPISIAAFMTEALFDPRHGFYATKDPIGAGADFITAPEISQMFGELVGLVAAQTWLDMGRPDGFKLIEMGPGRGTMMSDALRAARTVPGFMDATEVVLIEASAALKAVQAQTLGPSGAQIRWVDRLDAVAPGPSFIVGNEFLDCLPVRQALRHKGEWHERLVGLAPADGDGDANADESDFVFVLGPPLGQDADLVPARLQDADDGALVELRPGDRQVIDQLAARFATQPGRALFIDYGPATSEIGDTLQAIRAHKKQPPLAAPGTADLTARVDFESLIQAGRSAGLSAHGPQTQGNWLTELGLEARAAVLSQSRPGKRAEIARQIWRLTDKEQMGELFKLVSLDSADLPPPPGFSAG